MPFPRHDKLTLPYTEANESYPGKMVKTKMLVYAGAVNVQLSNLTNDLMCVHRGDGNLKTN